MSITALVQTTSKAILRELDRRGSLEKAAELALRRIIRRTAQGLDKDRKPFAPYAKGTVKRKGTSRVTLRDTGEMLNALAVTDEGTWLQGTARASIGAKSAEARKRLERHVHGTKRMPRRDPMGLAPDDEREVQRFLQREALAATQSARRVRVPRVVIEVRL